MTRPVQILSCLFNVTLCLRIFDEVSFYGRGGCGRINFALMPGSDVRNKAPTLKIKILTVLRNIVQSMTGARAYEPRKFEAALIIASRHLLSPPRSQSFKYCGP